MVLFNLASEPFRFYKIFMKANGVWPLDRRSRASKIVFSITTLVQLVIFLIGIIHPLPKCHPTEVRNSQNQRIAIIIFGVLSQIGLRIGGRSMVPLIKTTIDDWSSMKQPNERNIMKRYDHAGALFCYAIMVYFGSVGLVWHFMKLFVTDKFILTDKQQNCGLNDAIWTNRIQVLSVITALFSEIPILTSFVLFWSFAMHLSGQYNILKKEFQDFLQIKAKQASRKEFCRLVHRHIQLCNLSGRFEDSFSLVLAVQIVILQLCICINTFRKVTNRDIFSVQTLVTLTAVFFTAIMLYMYYYAGDYLITCSKEVGEVLIRCNWYNLSNESMTNFSIVIARSQNPKHLTVAKMYKLNLPNLKHGFNALYTYMSCIVALVNANKNN